MRSKTEEFSAVARLLHDYGWAEAMAGNMSLRLPKIAHLQEEREDSEEMAPLAQPFPGLAQEQILITGSGSRMRDIAANKARGIDLLEITADGAGYNRLAGEAAPSTELLMHLALHEKNLLNGDDRSAVLHTHPTHLIAMTRQEGMEEEGRLLEALYSVHAETRLLLDGAIRLLPFRMPGSLELAKETAAALEQARVAIWPFHGIVACAEGLNEALDYVALAEKAAQLYLATPGGVTPPWER